MESTVMMHPFDVTDTENIIERWTIYHTRLSRYFLIKDVKEETMKITYLFFLGGHGIEVIYDQDKLATDTYRQVVAKISTHFNPTVNVQLNIFHFRSIAQFDGEPFDEFVKRLKEKGGMCQFVSLETELLNQIIQKCYSRSLRRKALLVTALKYEDLIKLGRLEELVDKQVSEMSQGHSPTSREVDHSQEPCSNTNTLESRWKSQQNTVSADAKHCFSCGGSYPHRSTCPARGTECFKCQGFNHYAKMCRWSQDVMEPDTSARVNAVHEAHDPDYYNRRLWQINSSNVDSSNKKPQVEIKLSGVPVYASVDTGAEHDIIDEQTWDRILDKPKLYRTRMHLYPYGSPNEIKTLGEFRTRVQFEKKDDTSVAFIITEGRHGILLTYDTCCKLGVLSRIMGIPKEVRAKDIIIDPIKRIRISD